MAYPTNLSSTWEKNYQIANLIGIEFEWGRKKIKSKNIYSFFSIYCVQIQHKNFDIYIKIEIYTYKYA